MGCRQRRLDSIIRPIVAHRNSGAAFCRRFGRDGKFAKRGDAMSVGEMNQRRLRSRRKERGSALVEFVLASVLLIIPLLFGTFIFGMRLVRANQVAEVCRDAGHMYAYGVDFSQSSSQNMLVTLAQGLNITTTGGNGVIILSTITYIASNDCIAGGYPSGNCPNVNNTVFTKRIVIGNPSLYINSQLQQSAFGTPAAAIVDSSGNISSSYYLSNSSAIAANFENVIPIGSGQFAYVAEAFFGAPDFNLLNPGGISARSIF